MKTKRLARRAPSRGTRPLIWLDCRLCSLADVRAQGASVVFVPVAWHERAHMLSRLAAVAVTHSAELVIEYRRGDRLVEATIRSLRQRRDLRIRCVAWRDVSECT